MSESHRPIYEIARDIRSNWTRPYFGAIPYIKAMHELNSINDMYMYDTAKTVVLYFLANASTWHGDTACRIQAELKKIAGVK